MSEEQRQLVMMHEGQLLQAAGMQGDARGAMLARCVVDGALNALIRIEGADEAAKYALALGDRIVGRLKGPTLWPPPKAEPAPLSVTAPAVKTDPKRMSFWTIWFFGLACGLVLGLGMRVGK